MVKVYLISNLKDKFENALLPNWIFPLPSVLHTLKILFQMDILDQINFNFPFAKYIYLHWHNILVNISV